MWTLINKIINKLKLIHQLKNIHENQQKIKTNIYRHTQLKLEKIYHDFSFYYFSQVSWLT